MKRKTSCSVLLVVSLASVISGCGVVGWKYRYGGTEYTMTEPSIEYHRQAVTDVRKRYGDYSAAQQDPAALEGACKLLQRYATDAPDGGSFTPARELLDADARVACQRAQELTARAEAKTASERRQAEAERERRRYEEERRASNAAEERRRIEYTLARDTKTLEVCTATEQARVARKRHQEILERAPGATVRKECSPRMATEAVRAECKDANGFSRTCTKTVSTGEVASYSCPKTLDPEVIQLGLYQLDLLDSFPFPEDQRIRVRDEDCTAAQTRAQEQRARLDKLAAEGGSN